MNLIDQIEKEQMKALAYDFNVGDTVRVDVKIIEGDRERTHAFEGIVIARSGRGLREMFAVRRIVGGEGVERTFPLHSPSIVDIKVIRRGEVRRAKLTYLRKRVGKATRVKEKRAVKTEQPAKE